METIEGVSLFIILVSVVISEVRRDLELSVTQGPSYGGDRYLDVMRKRMISGDSWVMPKSDQYTSNFHYQIPVNKEKSKIKTLQNVIMDLH